MADPEAPTPPQRPFSLAPKTRDDSSEVWLDASYPRERTDPRIQLERMNSEYKRRLKRKPWYAAGVTALMFAVASAITATFVQGHQEAQERTKLERQLEVLLRVDGGAP